MLMVSSASVVLLYEDTPHELQSCSESSLHFTISFDRQIQQKLKGLQLQTANILI